MAFRSWVKLSATTATAAAVVGAGQLGIAYALTLVRFDRVIEVTARDQWTSQLAWVAWIAMTAAAIGAVVGVSLRQRWLPQPVGTGGALVMGLSAALGALATLPLTMQPARAAQVTGVHPAFVIGVCAGLGAAIGIFAAWAAAARPAARWNIVTLTVLMWIVALISIGPSLKPGGATITSRLGVLEGDLIPAALSGRTPFLTMPTLALLAGLVVGWTARGHRMPVLAVALAGLPGPALLTMAYLIAGPGSGGAGFTLSPYWAAMTAAGAGVLGSVLAAIVRPAPGSGRPRDDRPSSPSAPVVATPEPPAPDTTASAPEADNPLPRRDVPTQSAIAQAAAVAAQRPDEQLRPSDTGIFTTSGRPHPLADLASASGQATVPPQAPRGQTYGSAQGQTYGQPQEQPTSPAQPDAGPRFSGQQPPAEGRASSIRGGWRSRREATPASPAAATTASPAGDPAFDGFAAAQSGTATPPGRAKPGEGDYVDWVNGLGGA
ncbi:hypothetical protein [Actinoplanes rectilineatus]|uniref:hypothetical protein n=1 Tax=Actinoplanes rectilineatus TaxID=113571 RepID=UPI0012F89B72|nr:hypothetical protein [Actinoplanes rectilineatus]